MDFKTFLFKYSFVDSKFVDDFYNIIREDYIERYNEFLIDSEALRNWLKINNRRIFNDTIKRSYRKGIDYKIEKIKETSGSGGHNKEIITITPDTAKKICLSTNSKIGPKVQQYFLDIELALYKYKNHIIESMAKKIEQLENNQKPKVNTNKKILYVFRALNTDLTLYKIGKTINSKNRFNQHNSPMANDLEVIFSHEAEDIDQIESCVKSHIKKAQYRKYKEIYQVDLDIIKKSIKNCECDIAEFNKEIKKRAEKIKNGKAKQKGGQGITEINPDDKLFMLIPK